jgi:tetratricopeptide (TPR) repeat protein
LVQSSPGGLGEAFTTTVHLRPPELVLEEVRRASYNRVAFKLTRVFKTLNSSCSEFEDIIRLRVAAMHERAKALQTLGRHEAAVEDFTDVLGHSPGAVSAYFRRGLSLRTLRCYSAAADDLETARSVIPRNERFSVNYFALRDVDAAAASFAGEEAPSAVMGLDGDADAAVGHLYVG